MKGIFVKEDNHKPGSSEEKELRFWMEIGSHHPADPKNNTSLKSSMDGWLHTWTHVIRKSMYFGAEHFIGFFT